MKKLDEFLNKPGGAFLMNLLAQQGYSTMPGSPLGAVGRASQATQQQMMQQKQLEEQNKARSFQQDMMRKQLGLGERRLDAQIEGNRLSGRANTNVASTERGTDGYLHIVRRDGSTERTDIEFDPGMQYFTNADGSVDAVPKNNPTQRIPVITPEDAAASTTRGAQNEVAAGASTKVPTQSARVKNTVTQIDEIRDHPGLRGSVGFKGSAQLFGLRDNPVAGTDEAGFRARLDQLIGGTFLEAYQQLKGGGQITEIEARKAQDAMNRLSNVDQKESEWLKALDDYESAVVEGFRKLEREAAGDFNATSGDSAVIDSAEADAAADRILNGGR